MEKIKKLLNRQYYHITNILNSISTHEGLIKYFKNTGWLFTGRILSMVASFFVGIYVARYLGPSRYGLLSYILSFTALFSIFTSFGIDNILNRELIPNPENKDKLLGSGFIIKLFGAIISITFIIITLLFLKADKLTNILILISSLSFIFSAFGVIDIYFQSQVAAGKTVRVQIISLTIVATLKLFFIYLNLNLIYFVITYVIEGFIMAVGLVIIYKKSKFNILNWRLDKNIVVSLLKNSWPLMLSGIAYTTYLKIDQVMIKNILGNEASGLYAVAVRLSEIWYFIPAVICTSLFPAIINSRTTNIETYNKRLKNLYLLLIFISIFISMFICIFSNEIVNILFGSSYMQAFQTLRIYIWSSVPIFLGTALGSYLIAENLLKIGLVSTIIGATLNVVLNIILIPKYGIMGGAIVTLISYSSVTITTFIILRLKKKL